MRNPFKGEGSPVFCTNIHHFFHLLQMLLRPLLRPLSLQARLLPQAEAALGVDGHARAVHSLPASFTKRNQWNKAVSEAEKLVRFNLFHSSYETILPRLATQPLFYLSGPFLTMTLPTLL